MDTVSAPTNSEVGARIGLTHSAVSRIRSGERLPSMSIMRAIEDEYGWDRLSQWAARDEGKYAECFEAVIRGAAS